MALACGRQEDPASDGAASQKGAVTIQAALNTAINKSIEIDQQTSGVDADDANLYVGNDPADGTSSYQKPTGGPATWIDWHDLGSNAANHQLLDTDLASGKDPTSFPGSNECVGDSNVLSKMDLRYVAAANNNTYAYFAVLRSNNNGDAGYYWLFTKLEPHQILGQSPCAATHKRLVYDISLGDVLLAGHFKPNGSPLLRVFKANKVDTGVDAVNAIDFNNARWTEDTNAVSAVAINTTITAPGALGSAGVLALKNGNLDTEVFAEAAVPVSVFTGGVNCGAQFYGSVITRSSGSGGTSPDLKDLAGPSLFNFGTPSASAALTPTCTQNVGFAVSNALDMFGNPIQNATCTWAFDDGTSTTGCSGSISLPVGARSATVTIDDPAPFGCDIVVETAQVNVYAPLSVDATLTPTCNGTFDFQGVVSGGSSPSLLWGFTGGGTVSSSTSTLASGTVAVGTGGVAYTGNLTVTDLRPEVAGGQCTASDSDTATPYKPISISLARSGAGGTCPGLTSDAVTYSAVVSEGSGSYQIAWYGANCAGASCMINPADSTYCASNSLYAIVTDNNPLCSPDTSETETYSKVTTVLASDN